MSDKVVKSPRKKYSKATLALSAPPKFAKVEINKEDESDTMQVSAPIANQIKKLYHKESVDRSPHRLSYDEKHPLILSECSSRSISNVADNSHKSVTDGSPKVSCRRKKSSDNTMKAGYSDSPKVLNDIQSKDHAENDGIVHIVMGNGEVMLFNNNLDAFVVHNLSPSSDVAKDVDTPVNTNSSQMNDTVETFIKEIDKESVNDINLKVNIDKNQISEGSLNIDYTDNETSTNIKAIRGHSFLKEMINQNRTNKVERKYTTINDTTKSLNSNKQIQSDMPSTIHCEGKESVSNSQNVPKNNPDMLHESDLDADSRISSDNDEEHHQKNDANESTYVKKGKYTTTGPSMRKIDKYRESLRRRINENRSVSEPFSGDTFSPAKITEKRDNDKSAISSPEMTLSSKSDTPVPLRQRRYLSKSTDRPTRPTSCVIVKSTVVRSSSLSNLTKLSNSLEDIPKGIAKSKIEQIQKRETEIIPADGIKSPVWFTNSISPKLMSPTGSGSSTPRYGALSPTQRYGALSPINTSVSTLAFKYNSLSAKVKDQSFSPISKQAAIQILHNTLPRSMPKSIPISDDGQSTLPKHFKQNLVPSETVHDNIVSSFLYPKPTPRAKYSRHSSIETRRSSEPRSISSEPISINSQSSASSSLYSTQSSGDDVSDKADYSSTPPTPKRLVRAVKRSSSHSNTCMINKEDDCPEPVSRTSKVPYTQVMPSRKKALVRMGVNSFRNKRVAPDPPNENDSTLLSSKGNIVKKVEMGGDLSSFTFVQGKSGSLDNKTYINKSDASRTPNTKMLNLFGVTEDFSTDFDVQESDQGNLMQDKKTVYEDSEITNDYNDENGNESFIVPAPLDFSDLTEIIDRGRINVSVDKENCVTQETTFFNAEKTKEQTNKPVPPPRLKKSASYDMKRISDINGNTYVTVNGTESKSTEDETDDTLVQKQQRQYSSDYSSSDDNMLEIYNPTYETITNMNVRRRKVQHSLDGGIHDNKEFESISVSNNLENNTTLDDQNNSKNNNETINYPMLHINQSDTPIKDTKIDKSKKRKEKKQSKKRAKSTSPRRNSESMRNSSDEDLLDERSRKRTMSPTSVAKDLKDTVKKMLKGRPGSPKERGDKNLSMHENNSLSRKGVLSAKLNSSSTHSSTLPGESDGITLLSIQNNGDKFDVHRYAGGHKNKTLKRASKSMGDIKEEMDVSQNDEKRISYLRNVYANPLKQKNMDTNTKQRQLPKIPTRNETPSLVKVFGKEDETKCQYFSCVNNHIKAIKICQNSDCMAQNDERPLMLCQACDKQVHSDAEFSSHVRFDIFKKGGNLNRNASTRSLPGLSQSDDEGGGAEEDIQEDNDEKKNSKLRRKKVMKKRYHTDDTNSPVIHIRSNSLQENVLFDNKATFSNKSESILNQSESAITAGYTRESQKEPCLPTTDVPLSQQESQESVFENGSETANQNTEDIIKSGLKDIPSSKSAESTSLQDNDYEEDDDDDDDDDDDYEDYDDDDEGFSSILNSSPVISANSGTEYNNNTTQSAVVQDKSDSRGSSVSAGRDLVDSGKNLKTKTLSHNKKSKDETSKKFTMGKEYFTLKFDILDDPEVYEIVAAVKGVSLRDAVSSCLERRGINVNDIDIFLASSNTALPLHVQCFPLGGSHLHVKAKENEQIQQRGFSRSVSAQSLTVTNKTLKQSLVPKPSKLPPSQKGKKGSSVSTEDGSVSVVDISPHGTLTSSDTAKITKSLRPPSSTGSKLGNLFGSPFTKNKHEALLQQLESYSHEGLPGMPVLLTMGKPEYDEQVFSIENHWTDVVQIPKEDLSKKQRDQQETIWELLYTEVEHVRKLKVVIDLYYCCLMDLQNETILNDVRTEDVFSNIIEVSECNQEFWNNYLKNVLDHSRKTKTLLDPSLLKEAFMKFEEIFKPYAKYCLEQKACLDYIKAKQGDNELFRTFIEWAEAQKQCNRLKLIDLIIIPMQRLTKYKLLLLAILKKTEREDHRKDLIHMIEKVERFVLQVNQVMHQRAEHERLSMIIERIEAYDVIDAPNIEEVQRLASDYCKLDLTCPVPGCGPQQRRHLLLEGGLKFREASSRLDVYCFLFTDMLLVTKPNKRGDKVKVTKPPMRLDKCVVQLLRDGVSFMLVYLNEYHVASGVYTFHGDAAKIWVDHVRRTQEAYKQLRKQALEKTESRMYWEMFYEENYEDDLAVINNRNGSNGSGEVADRQDSSSSAESFMPNLDSMPRSNSHSHLRYDPVGQESNRRLRISNSLDENSVLAQAHHSQVRDTVQRSDSEPTRVPPLSLPRHSISDNHISDYSDSPSLSRSSVQPDVYYAASSKGAKARSVASRTDSQSSGEGQVVRPAPRTKHQHRELANRPMSMLVDSDAHRSKLSQRRRNEKRYHTADKIQELRKDNRDTSIHKRLSWNLGTHTVDISIDDRQTGFFNGKTFSSDSIKSMPSSSGVSSTGSLHLSPESEICEEDEENHLHPYTSNAGLFDSALFNHESTTSRTNSKQLDNSYQKLKTLPQQTDLLSLRYSDEANHSDSSTNESSATITAEQTVTVNSSAIDEDKNVGNTDTASESGSSANGESLPNNSANSSSKSLPDISNITLQDVSSADAKGLKKMSHRDLLTMKKQLLLNSTLEASEV